MDHYSIFINYHGLITNAKDKRIAALSAQPVALAIILLRLLFDGNAFLQETLDTFIGLISKSRSVSSMTDRIGASSVSFKYSWPGPRLKS